MKYRFMLSAFLFFVTILSVTKAQVKHVVIAAVYGGGSNSGALFQYDFIELFNPTSIPAALTNYSVQYSSATSASWQKQAFSAIIPAGGFFLIQLNGNAGSPVGAALPTPDVVGTINLSATVGKVALANVDVSLSGTGMGDITVIDLVGYGATASGYETMPAPGITSKKCLVRINNGCTDINDNSLDFTASTSFVPQNSASPASRCDGLPVKIVFFSASISNDKVSLHWQTTSELTFNSFIVEESEGIKGFVAVANIKSKNATSGSNYDYTSTSTLVGKEYYRLKLIDNDGSFKYSAIVFVNGNTSAINKLVIYPNPVANTISINYPKAVASTTIRIMSVDGKIFVTKQVTAGSMATSFDVSKLPASSYYLSYENDGVRTVSKFIKN